MRILYLENRRSDNPLDSFMGVVGQSTDLTDSCGNKLCVGDIVLSVDGSLNFASTDIVVCKDPRIVRHSDDVYPFIMGLKNAKFAKINCSLEDFFGVSEYDLIFGTEDEILDRIRDSVDRQKLNEDLWYSTLFERGIDVHDGYSVPSCKKLKYATIDDKDYYDRINKRTKWQLLLVFHRLFGLF